MRAIRFAFAALLVTSFVLCDPTSSLRAQEEEIAHGPINYCPWNGHDYSPGASNYLADPSNEIASSYANVNVTNSPRFQTECSIAINPRDSNNMLIETIDGDHGQNGMYVSIDGGSHWHSSTLPIDTTGGYYAGDPWVTFDAAGSVGATSRAYCCALQYNRSARIRLAISSSRDNGSSWKVEPAMLDYGTIDTSVDEPVIAVDRNPVSPYFNSLYAISASDGNIPLLGFGPIGIHLQARRADANVLSPQVRVSQIGLAQVPHVTFGLHGEIYIAYIGITNILNLTGALYLNKSIDGGATWSKDHVIAASGYTDTINGFPRVGFPAASRMGPTPRIVIDTSNGPRRGWLYVTYAMPSTADHKHNLDIFIQHSTDAGASWSSAARVNNDPVSSTNDQLTPCLAINPDGVLGVVFYDRREDPNNYLLHTYIAISTDGGATWDNQRVSSANTDPIAARGQIQLAVADYISIAATRSAFYPVWNDGRYNNGDLDIYTARVPIAKSGVSDAHDAIRSLSLYPNPSSGESRITFTAHAGQHAEFVVYDVLGQEVSRVSLTANGGHQTFLFDARKLAAATYRGVLVCPDSRQSVKFVRLP
jgi:hypothetical protein